jgi:hypothetical protein
MDLEMVFNELSLKPPASSVEQARQWMTQFISLVTAATRQGVNRVLRTDADFQIASVAPNYSLINWRNDSEVSREERQFFRALTNKAPYLADLPQTQQTSLASEFFYQDGNIQQPVQGLGYAYLLDSIAVSLPSTQRWQHPSIQLEHRWIEVDEDIYSEQVEVKHCCHPDQVATHRDWITKRLQTGVRDGVDLWYRRDLLFSTLSFCESVATAIQGLGSGNPLLRQVVKQLFELEIYCRDWQEGGFEPDKLPCKVSPESPKTLEQYGQDRTFTCPDGLRRVFSWHVRLTPGAWRVHFLPDPSTRRVIIGYVGPHLPTVSDPT